MDQIPFALPDITEAEVEAVARCMRSGWLTSGKVVVDFEEAFARCVGAKHAIAVNSATTAALLILDSLGVGPGDEVIVPAYTFSGPAMMAHHLGATLKFADCLPSSYQIDPASVRNLMSPRTKVVMPTHFAGQACDMAALRMLCNGYGVVLVDDAAHAFPASYPDGSAVGSDGYARATFFSFYATKCLTTGEGGMITTADDVLAERLRRLRLHGFDRAVYDRYTNPATGWRYNISFPGWKANMTDLAAAMGLAQLERTPDMWRRRRRIASSYMEALSGVVGTPQADGSSAWHLFPIRVEGRDEFIAAMAARGVQCSVHFIPLPLHSFWGSRVGCPNLPNAMDAYAHEVSLPIFSAMTDEQVDRVIAAVLEVQEARNAGRA